MDLSESKIVEYVLLVANLYIVYSSLTRKRRAYQEIVAFAATAVAAEVCAFAIGYQNGNVKLTLLLIYFSFFWPILYVFKEHWTMKLFVFAVASYILQYTLLLHSFASAYMYSYFSPDVPPVLIYLLMFGMEMALLAFAYWRVLSWIKPVLKTFHNGNLVMGLLPSGACAILVVIYVNGVFDFYTLISTILITLILIATFNLISLTIRLTNRKNNLESQLLFQMDHYKNLAEGIQKSRIYRHDIRHHLACISEFLEKQETEAVQRYLDRLFGQYADNQMPAFCENKYVDAVLAHYNKIARQQSIRVAMDCYFPEQLGMEPLDVCVIIGNYFEYAIMACAATDAMRRQISLCGKIENGHMLITLTYHKVKDNTRSEDKQDCLENVRLLVRKYDGTINSVRERDFVTTTISVKMKTYNTF